MDVDPEAVVAAALSCPDVARLSGGLVGEVATYLPGRQVTGVRFTDEEVEVHIVARWGPPLPVEDIELPIEDSAPPRKGGDGAASP